MPDDGFKETWVSGVFACSLLTLSACADIKAPMVGSITVVELREVLTSNPEALLIDVRSHREYETIHAQPVKQVIVHTEIKNYLHLLPQDKSTPLYLICRIGNRSGKAGRYLVEQGYTRVYNVMGGTTAWQEMGFPTDSGRGVLETPF